MSRQALIFKRRHTQQRPSVEFGAPSPPHTMQFAGRRTFAALTAAGSRTTGSRTSSVGTGSAGGVGLRFNWLLFLQYSGVGAMTAPLCRRNLLDVRQLSQSLGCRRRRGCPSSAGTSVLVSRKPAGRIEQPRLRHCVCTWGSARRLCGWKSSLLEASLNPPLLVTDASPFGKDASIFVKKL